MVALYIRSSNPSWTTPEKAEAQLLQFRDGQWLSTVYDPRLGLFKDPNSRNYLLKNGKWERVEGGNASQEKIHPPSS